MGKTSGIQKVREGLLAEIKRYEALLELLDQQVTPKAEKPAGSKRGRKSKSETTEAA